MRSFILWCYCVWVIQTVQWHNLHFLLSPKFSFGGDTCGLQFVSFWSDAVPQPCLWSGCSADPVCLWSFSAVTAHIILYLASKTKQAFRFLSSPVASNYCKNVWRMSWSWRTGEKKIGLLLAVKRWGTNWKVSILLFISSSLPFLSSTSLFYVRSRDKNICMFFSKYVVEKFSF